MAVLKKVEQGKTEALIFLTRLKPEDGRPPWAPQDSDVMIDVLRGVRDSNNGIIDQSTDQYFISSSAVAKEITSFPPDNRRSAGATSKYKEDLLERENTERQLIWRSRKQATEEVYFPDKSDLQALSNLISSAN